MKNGAIRHFLVFFIVLFSCNVFHIFSQEETTAPAPATAPATTAAEFVPPTQTETTPEDFDPFLAEFALQTAPPEPEIKVELPAPPPPPSAQAPGQEVGLKIHIPYLGDFKLIPFEDTSKTPVESGLKLKFADNSKKIDLGGMTIDDGEIKLVDDKLSLTGRATIMGNKARFGLRSIQFGAGENNANRVVLGIEYETKPELNILPQGKKIVLEATDLELEENKPITLVASAKIADQTVRVALVLSKQAIDGFVELPPNSLLSTVIPSVAYKPTLKRAIIKEARIRANNLWGKEKSKKLHVVITGYVVIPPEDFQNTITNDPDAPQQPTSTTPETSTASPSSSSQPAATPPPASSINQLIDISSSKITKEQETGKKESAAKKEESTMPEEELKPGTFKLELTIARVGEKGSLKAKEFPIPGLGTIKAVSITIDTVKETEELKLKQEEKASYFKMSGTMSFDVADATPLDLTLECKISSKGFIFAGKVTDFTYAGITFKNLYVSFDTAVKAIDLIGELKIPKWSNTSLEAELRVIPDKQAPKDPTKRAILFSTNTSTEQIKPFSKVPGLESFYITDFEAGIDVLKIGKETTKSIYLSGKFHFLGAALDCIARLVKNAQNEEGVFVKAILAKDKKVSDIIKVDALNKLTLEEAEFVACSVDYIDIDSTTGVRTDIKKGLSLLATVPLTGPLEPVGTFFGMSNQTFSLYGNIVPNNLAQSAFGFLLSAGDPDRKKMLALGETKVGITQVSGIEVGTSIFFHPNEQEELKFYGKFVFKAASVSSGIPQPPSTEVHAGMEGTWKNPFGVKNAWVTDLAVTVGMSNPTQPNKFGGGGKFQLGDFKASVYFAADTMFKDCALKAEIPEPTRLSELAGKILKAYNINITDVKIPDPLIDHLVLEVAPKDVLIGHELIRQGLLFKGQFEVLGKRAYVHLMLRPPTLTGDGGFKIYGAIDPINIANGLLTVTKSSKEFGGTCFVPTAVKPCSVPDTAELQRAGQEFIKGKEVSDQKPRVDIEFTLQRQNFLISGAVNVANLFGSETCMSIDRRGMNLMMETGMRNKEGEVIMWNNKPLFLARVLANSSGDFSNPQVNVSIDFMQNLQAFLKDKADAAFRDAQREVVSGINNAQQEINKINGAIADAQKKIADAERQVASAKKNLEDIRKARDDAKGAIASAQRDVNSIRGEISKLDSWYNSLPAI